MAGHNERLFHDRSSEHAHKGNPIQLWRQLSLNSRDAKATVHLAGRQMHLVRPQTMGAVLPALQ